MKLLSTVLRKWAWRVLAIGSMVLFQSLQGVGVAAGVTPLATKALLLPEPGIAPGWLADHPDAPLSFRNMSQHSLRLSPISPYYPQIAYGGDHLYYAYQDAGGWHTQTVDNAWSVGSGAALALDASGKAHISYYDASNKNLKYATNKSGAWVSQTVVSPGDVGVYSDIAIDSWGDPAIVFFNTTTSELHYIYYDSDYGSWGNDEVVAPASDVGHPGWFSFVLDNSGTFSRPHVSYYLRSSSTRGMLQWAHYDAGSAWTHSAIDSCMETNNCRVGEYNSIVLNLTHQPVIAYSFFDPNGTESLMYAAYSGTNWVPDYSAPGITASYISLAIDVSGYAHLSWSEGYSNVGFKYARRDGQDTWNAAASLDASPTSGVWSSLAVVGTLAKVAQYNTASGVYAYIGHERSGWLAPVTVATQGHTVGNCTSLAEDGIGRSHISYFDSTSNSLLYARHNSDGSWFKNTIDSAGTASCFSVMAVNPATNDPSVGFIRGGSLWYSLGTTWSSPMQVDSGVSNTTYEYQAFGLALASDGAPHFAYRKGSDLWYAYWNGGWAHTKLVTGSVGSYIAMALGPDNQPHIAYYHSGVLNYTYYYNGGWLTETIAANAIDGSGVGVTLAVAHTGQPTAAYMNGVGTDLRVSTRLCLPVCFWTTGLLVDDNAEENFSLALDRTGNPHLAALAWVSGQGFQLDYITRQGGVWSVQAIDTNNGVGWYPSIGLTPAGTPRISYSDGGNNDLKFVLKLYRVFLPLIKR